MSALAYDDMREARRQILAVTDPQAQDALFTLLGLVSQLAERLAAPADRDEILEHVWP